MLAASFPDARMTEPLYKTTDVYLSAFLLSEGAKPEGRTRLAPKRVEFRFRADERLHELLRLYWRGRPLLVVPARLFGALRTLKERS
jgi:hypothetical protein